MAGVDDEHLCEDDDLGTPGGRSARESRDFLALAEDWLIAQEALQSYQDNREDEIRALRRSWDQGTLEIDVEALADRLLEQSFGSQQNRQNRPAT